jgi:hypothetical protein
VSQIIVEQEPEEIKKQFWGAMERCVFCFKETTTWHKQTNTPICEDCAKTQSVETIGPAKKKAYAKQLED